ncbi:MAG: phage holin family protein, partial [Actinomycetota bacterium]
ASWGVGPVSTTSGQPGTERSLGEIVSDIASDMGTLVRQEMELAKTEIKQEVSKAGKGAGLLGGAGVGGYLALLFLSLTVMFALGEVMDLVWAALVVTVLWAVVAAVLAAAGRKRLRSVDPSLTTTKQTLKEDARWAKTVTPKS